MTGVRGRRSGASFRKVGENRVHLQGDHRQLSQAEQLNHVQRMNHRGHLARETIYFADFMREDKVFAMCVTVKNN
jgi:hypothetical protein